MRRALRKSEISETPEMQAFHGFAPVVQTRSVNLHISHTMVEITRDTSVEEAIKLAPDCRCNACEIGCRFGAGFLVKGDEVKLAQFLGMTVEQLKRSHLEEVEVFNTRMLRPKIIRKGKPYGRCTFFDEDKGCGVHPAKPLQCRTAMGCRDYGEQLNIWFTLNFIVDPDDPESVRQWATHLKMHPTINGGELKDLVKDDERLRKILSYEIFK